MELYVLTRHGESTLNLENRINGDPAVPVALTEKGREQALSLRVLEAPPSLSKAQRKSPEQMAVISEDLIKMLDHLANSYRRGHHPESKAAEKVAQMLRAVADELEL